MQQSLPAIGKVRIGTGGGERIDGGLKVGLVGFKKGQPEEVSRRGCFGTIGIGLEKAAVLFDSAGIIARPVGGLGFGEGGLSGVVLPG